MSGASDWKNGIVAIIGRTGPVGAGFIVSADGLIATCCHVVEQSEWPYGQFDKPLQVRFNAVLDDPKGRYADALLLESYFRPDLDLAILRLQADLPGGVTPLPLCGTHGSLGHTTYMFGYPAGFRRGLDAEGKVVGVGMQLQVTSFQATRGFSGGPVWAEKWQRVIGMMTSLTHVDSAERLQYENLALPAETLVAACEGLGLELDQPAEERELKSRQGKPLQRPPRAEHFTDREEDLAWLKEALQPGRTVTVWAAGGMGKTALSAEAVWQLADGDEPPERFPDGVVFYSFYGRPETALALEHIVRSFDREAQDVSEDAARRVLAGKRALLVLDGAEEAADLGAPLRLRDNNGVLINTRRRKDAPNPSWRLELEPLPEDEAVELLNAWQDADVSGEAGQAIVQQLGRLPLAVRLAGRYLDETGETPATYLRWLKETPIRTLSTGEHREESVAVLLEKSLSQVGELAIQALRAAGQLALADFSWEAVAAALEVEERPARQALSELFNYGLVGRVGGDRYGLSHALVHTYARQRLAAESVTVERLADYYTKFTEEESQKGRAGYKRLDLERPHFITLLDNCLPMRAYEATINLVWAVDDYLDHQGYWLDREQALTKGLMAAEKLGDRRHEGDFKGKLGNAYRNQMQVEKAIKYHEQALTISQKIADRRREGNNLRYLGVDYINLGLMEKAIKYTSQALDVYQEIDDRRGEGRALGNLGIAYKNLGQLEKAIKYYEQALAISQEIGDRRGERKQLGNLGNAYADLGQAQKAIGCHKQALAIQREIGDRQGQGVQSFHLANAYNSLGQVEKAVEYARQALAIFEDIKSPDAEQARRLLASLKSGEGD